MYRFHSLPTIPQERKLSQTLTQTSIILERSVRQGNKLMVGPDIAHRVHTDGLYSQYQELKSKSFFSLLARLYIPFPRMNRRVAEMHIFLEETNFSQMPHPDKTLMGSAGAGTRPQARPALAASDPYTVDPAFRREAPLSKHRTFSLQ